MPASRPALGHQRDLAAASMKTEHDLRCELALLRAPGVGPAAFRDLTARFGSASAALEAGKRDSSLDRTLKEYLAAPDWAGVDADLAWAGEPGCHLLALGDSAYPESLAETVNAPPLLFVRGDPEILRQPQLAIVGSRNPSPSGRDTAREFARHFAGAGLGVTSGLALGVDAAAHEGALAGKGHTVAVMGTGPNRIYPARHRDLAHRIVDMGGALVSEFPSDTAPLPNHFPRRNRIISGLALGTLVVEAAIRSGSLITARTAAEQGREVFAIPGSIHNPLARGCHRLIRDGAKLVETAGDVLEELAPQLRHLLAEGAGNGAAEPAEAPDGEELDPDRRRLLESLDYGPTPVDLVVERSGLTAEAVSSMLLLLELEGYVEAAPGGRYARTSKRA